MAHNNRTHQLKDIANKDPRHEERHDELAKGELSSTSSQSGTNHLVPVPVTLKAQLGSPVGPRDLYTQCPDQRLINLQTAFAIGAFSTTLTTLSLSLMEWRGVTITNVYIGNFLFAAGWKS